MKLNFYLLVTVFLFGFSLNNFASDVITIEAENLTAQGGDYSDGSPNGSGISIAEGVGINFVNNGDWAEYELVIPADGNYQFTYHIAPAGANPNIRVYIDDVEKFTDSFTQTAGWENYQAITSTSSVELTAGTYTLKIEAFGSAWQWNMDKMEISALADEANVESISLNETKKVLLVEGTFQLEETILPVNATDKTVSWESDNTDIATVVDGLVTAVAEGTANITVTATDNTNGTITASCEIMVVNKIEEASLTVDDANKYTTTDYVSGGTLEFTLNYNAGTGYTVTDGMSGMKVLLREIREGWAGIQQDYVFTDESIVGTQSGQLVMNLSLENVPPVAEITEGNFYFLFPQFTSSNGSTYQVDGLSPISIIAGSTTGVKVVDNSKLMVYPNPVREMLNITGLSGVSDINIYNLSAKIVKTINKHSAGTTISVNELNSGIYFLDIRNENTSKKIKFSKVN